MRVTKTAILLATAAVLGGCDGRQSVLAPESHDAERYATLAWIMFAGGTLIFVVVLAAIALSFTGSAATRELLSRDSSVLWTGLAFPLTVLAALLAYGASLTGAGRVAATGSEAPLRISVVGEQWWWRIAYHDADSGSVIHSANEIRIPVGRPVALTLSTPDVIHSFWVPQLAGKTDMIPGRETIMHIAARREAVMRGQCAEYCGGAHARMALDIVSMSAAEFAAWRAREALPASEPRSELARMGRELFLARGCGGCHRIAGTPAAGRIGPDLTHVAGRTSLAAATLPNGKAAMKRWIRDNQLIKPGNRMLPYDLAESELDAIAEYMAGLR